MEWLRRLSTLVLGDPSLEGLQSAVGTYEELHAEVQSILVPTPLPNGLQINVMQPLNKSFALTHRMYLDATKADRSNPLAALMGEKPKPSPQARIYALGGLLSHRFDSGAVARVFAATDTLNMSKVTAMVDPFGTGRVRLTLQSVSDWEGGSGAASSKRRHDWGVAAVVRGSDYAATARLATGPEGGITYHQRLVPGSPVTLGGEAWLNLPMLRAVAAGAPGKGMEWAVGASYDARTSRSSAHFVSSGSSNALLNLQHLYRVTDRSTLAAKTIMDLQNLRSMSAVGYKLTMRSTHTTVTGMADTYGGVRTMIERELLRGVKLSWYLHYNAFQPGAVEMTGADDANAMGIKVTIGSMTRIERPYSPCTMNRTIFMTN